MNRFATLMVCGVLAACVGTDEVLSSSEQESAVDNGSALNGRNLNGRNLNGRNLNGRNLNGRNLNGSVLGNSLAWVRFDSAELDRRDVDAWIEGSELVGRLRGQRLEGSELEGASFRGRSDTGKLVKLRVSEVITPAADDVWRYQVEYWEPGQGWSPICSDEEGAYPAFALNGYWDVNAGEPGDGSKVSDPERFLFACSSIGAIGKCVELGYRPWDASGGESLDAYHQACVRLMRADYCGDGVSHTSDGSVVNLYDDLGIQLDTETWTTEAEWDTDGALCLSPHNRSIEEASCYAERLHDACGSNFEDGTLLISETPDP
jgi:uncharacterized protein YjbI with pentapeptide repeats